MSEMVTDDTRNGMKMLLEVLLPKLITKVNDLSARVTELEQKLVAVEQPKPKRTRTKKVELTPYEMSAEDREKICDLYNSTVGAELQRLDVEVDTKQGLYVNGEKVSSELVNSIKEYMTNNPAAVITDVCNATNCATIVACFVAVVFRLWEV